MGARLPNLFLLGAPKCGTTSLVSWLKGHPNVYFPALKEPHYFNTDDRHRNVRTERAYRRLFRHATADHRILGDASVWYLSSGVAVSNILGACGDARFLVMLRNPLEMAPSLHQQNLYALYEDIESFTDAWHLQPERRLGRSVPATCRDPRHLLYGDACCLGEQAKRLLATVDRRRVLWVFLEDVERNPRREYQRVLAFLDLPDDGRDAFPKRNAAKTHRSRAAARLITSGSRVKRVLGIARSFGLDRANRRARSPAPTGPGMLSVLRDRFEDDVRLLGTLTGRDLAHWLRMDFLDPAAPTARTSR